MTTLCRRAFLTVAMISLIVYAAEGSEEPRGLLLRKGLVTWQMNVKDARRFIELLFSRRPERVRERQPEDDDEIDEAPGLRELG